MHARRKLKLPHQIEQPTLLGENRFAERAGDDLPVTLAACHGRAVQPATVERVGVAHDDDGLEKRSTAALADAMALASALSSLSPLLRHACRTLFATLAHKRRRAGVSAFFVCVSASLASHGIG